tara:strand:+ start:2292 stop:3383 length:1092 start_codon:yes stop_codon:yes gene_type:complete
MKKAFITGITGQDGSYLAEFLINKGYEVHGLIRRSSSFNTSRIDHLYSDPHQKNRKLILHYGDLSDSTNIIRLVNLIRPNEIYNLGAMSHVRVSFDSPLYTADIDALGTLRILEAIRLLNLEKQIKFYQASTSELYGLVKEVPQSELTPFYPRSPYGVAKLYSYWITVNYREAYQIFACNGILFNHESPRRGETFVTKKIIKAACKIFIGQQKKIYLGNLDSKRDWGHAKDYVEAMYLMLQSKKPVDYVISTGITTSVRDFLIKTFSKLGITIGFKNQGIDEIGYIKDIDEVITSKFTNSLLFKVGQEILEIDKNYYRPTEVDLLIGDSSKARKELKWKPKYNLDSLIDDMINTELEELNNNE